MEHDRGPRTPTAISIRECQEAIEIAGGIRISLRGEERLITEGQHGWGREYPVVSAEIFASP